MAYNVTTDHEEIRSWISTLGGAPAVIMDDDISTEDLLTISFVDPTPDIKLVTWEEFFDRFEQNNLALRYPKEDDKDRSSVQFSFIDRDRHPAGISNETLPPDDDNLILQNTYTTLPENPENNFQ